MKRKVGRPRGSRNKVEYTTREVEQEKNQNMFTLAIVFATIIAAMFSLLIWFNVPHCYYQDKDVKIILPKWTSWTNGTEFNGNVIYCDEWITQYGNKVFNYDIYKDGLCIVNTRERVCK